MCSRVSAISFASSGSSIYTAGADGMICEIDSLTGNLLGKFKASTKAISSMSVSAGTVVNAYMLLWSLLRVLLCFSVFVVF